MTLLAKLKWFNQLRGRSPARQVLGAGAPASAAPVLGKGTWAGSSGAPSDTPRLPIILTELFYTHKWEAPLPLAPSPGKCPRPVRVRKRRPGCALAAPHWLRPGRWAPRASTQGLLSSLCLSVQLRSFTEEPKVCLGVRGGR